MSGLVFLAVMIAVAGLLVVLEYRHGVRDTDWRNNLSAWAMQMVASAAFIPFLPAFQGHALIDAAALPWWIAFPIYFVIHDLGEYLFHRAQHRIPALWAMHALHHSDPNMSALTTQRHFWGDQLIKTMTIWSAASFVVSPTAGMVVGYAVLSLWNFVVHSALPFVLGRWSWLVNSPAYHRRHHSSLPEHYDSNFAALLPIFDVIAGSYHRPDGFPPTGLDRRPANAIEVAVWPLVISDPRGKVPPEPANCLNPPPL
jgi:sterol desaturase/sphingolipid hydroxylase (fatty acid hydroxylase superfamily)